MGRYGALFSAPTVHLYLDLSDSDNVCSSEKELLEFLRTYVSPKSMDPENLKNKSAVQRNVRFEMIFDGKIPKSLFRDFLFIFGVNVY